MMKKTLFFFLALSFTVSFSQKKASFIYYQKDDVSLNMHVVYPPNFSKNKQYTTMVFYFGGGWKKGKTQKFAKQAAYFASRGLLCFLPQYRTEKSHGTTPRIALQDAKYAMRYLRSHASELSIDSKKMIVAGGSAGGQLAAAQAFTTNLNHENDDLVVSTIPNALVLFNPVVDNGPEGYGYDRGKDYYKDFSPIHNISKLAPPTLFLLGTTDRIVPVSVAKEYKVKMNAIKKRCDVWLFEGQKHGFYNYVNLKKHSESNNYNYYKTIHLVDDFLQSIGFISGKPTVEVPESQGINLYLLD